MTNARATRVVLLAVSALALAACTPAVSANAPADPFVDPIVPQGGSAQSADQGTGSASAPRKGSGAVSVALVGGAQLPEQVVSAFTKDTGFTVGTAAYDAVGDVPAQSTDVVLGLDGADALAAAGASLAGHVAVPQVRTAAGTEVAGAEGAVAYGRDDVCVVADRAWMSANMLAVPSSIQELASASYAGLLAPLRPALAAPSCRPPPRRSARGSGRSPRPCRRGWGPARGRPLRSGAPPTASPPPTGRPWPGPPPRPPRRACTRWSSRPLPWRRPP